MVSEGVDVPRLRVGVYATSARTELFFRQVVGRFIRRTPAPKDQMSHVFLPSDPTLKRLAAQIEEERNHALALSRRARPSSERGERRGRARRSARCGRARTRDDDVLQTTQPGDALQLFADAAPARAGRVRRLHHDGGAVAGPESRHERRERLRDERRALVARSRADRRAAPRHPRAHQPRDRRPP